ncbi:MAG: DUF805 domain-containing protein [Rhodoferax sp.]|nr:DUF805 domain-containing protein [Rhodoferax sp.]
MQFQDAIKTCFSKYAAFEGIASRSEFWWWCLFVFLANAAGNTLSQALGGLVAIATLLPSIAVTTRRLHDINRSGWWQLVALVPMVGWLVLLYWCVQDSQQPNRFAPQIS